MNIALDALSIQAFKSYDEIQVVDFRELSNGFYYIAGENRVEPRLGSNGAGKSTLWDALLWVCCGKTAQGLKADNVVNWNSKRQCQVELFFTGNKGQSHTLTRRQSPNSLMIDNQTVEQETVEDHLGLDFTAMLYSVLISQEGSKFFDLTSEGKMKVFTDIMEAQLLPWMNSSERAKELADEKGRFLIDINQDISWLEGLRSSLKSLNYDEQTFAWNEEHKLKGKRLKDTLEEVQEDITSTDDNLTKTKEAYNHAKDEQKSLEHKLLQEEEVLSRYREKLMKFADNLGQLKGSLSTHLAAKEQLESLEGKCPLCQHILTEKHKQNELRKIKEVITVSAALLKENDDRAEKIKEDVEQNKDRVTKLKTDLKTVANLVNERNLRIKSLEGMKENSVDKLKDTRDQYAQWAEEVNPIEKIAKTTKKKLKVIAHIFKYAVEEKQEATRLFQVYDYLKKGFKDVRLLVVQEALKEFEIQINNNLQKLGMPDWNVELDIDSDTKSKTVKKGFTIMVKSPYNPKPVPFEAWSGGEGQRLRLAGTFGLMDFIHDRRGTDWNIEAFDEPTQWLSGEGIEDLLESLYYRSRDLKKKIFIIDHRDFKSYGGFSGIIKTVKDTKGSHIEQE